MSRLCKSLLFVILAVAPTVAGAQTNSEREKRRAHVPYIRAMTDCVALHAQQDPNFRQAVVASNLFPLLNEIARSKCVGLAAEMALAHDRLFGSGGIDFFNGPYLKDLERAVRARAKSKIDSILAEEAQMAAFRKAEAERAAAAQAERVQTAESVTAAVRHRTYACVRREAGSMIMTSERAEVVARAAAVFCRNDIEALAEAVRQEARARGLNHSIDLEGLAREKVTEIVTAEIVKLRAELQKVPLEPKKTEPTY